MPVGSCRPGVRHLRVARRSGNQSLGQQRGKIRHRRVARKDHCEPTACTAVHGQFDAQEAVKDATTAAESAVSHPENARRREAETASDGRCRPIPRSMREPDARRRPYLMQSGHQTQAVARFHPAAASDRPRFQPAACRHNADACARTPASDIAAKTRTLIAKRRNTVHLVFACQLAYDRKKLFPSCAVHSAVTVPSNFRGALAGIASSAGNSKARRLSFAASPEPETTTCVPAPQPDCRTAKSLPQSRVPATYAARRSRQSAHCRRCRLSEAPAPPAARGIIAAE